MPFPLKTAFPPLTPQGYRAPCNRLYRVESLNRYNEIVTVTPEVVEASNAPPLGDGTPTPSKPPPIQVRLLSSRGEDSDNESGDSGDEGGGEALAVQAIVDMLEVLDSLESVVNL